MMTYVETVTRRQSGAWKAKHSRILAAALDEFLDLGFNGASMDRIAVKAQVSKVTVYNHFETKDRLYRQMVDYYLTQVHPGLPVVELTPALTPRAALCRYGMALAEVTMSARSIGMIRLLRADPQSFDEAARGSGEARLFPQTKPLAAYLAAAGGAGRLNIGDVELAARQLLGMLLYNTVFQALSGRPPDQAQTSLQHAVDDCVTTFLSRFQAAD